MTMHPWLFRVPKIFYALAVVVFMAHFWLAYQSYSDSRYGLGMPVDDLMPAFLSMLLVGVTDAIWIAANGVLFQILLTFWVRFQPLNEDRQP